MRVFARKLAPNATQRAPAQPIGDLGTQGAPHRLIGDLGHESDERPTRPNGLSWDGMGGLLNEAQARGGDRDFGLGKLDHELGAVAGEDELAEQDRPAVGSPGQALAPQHR